jgi:type II secretory ATPase GspE/PulE/Tfp pilus assembly ATPase PilB-like protein
MAISYSPSPDAIARVPRAVAFRHDALALTLTEGVLAVALADPADANVVDLLRATTRLRIRPLPMPRDTIRERLQIAYGDASAVAAHEHADAPAVREVDLVFARAVAAHASDIHVEPSGDGGGRIRLRVDGILRELQPIPAAVFPAFCSRLKLIAALDIADRRQPQDGRCGIPYEGREIDARVASVPTIDGEKIVVRLLDRYSSAPDLATLGMPREMLARYRTALGAPWGFVVVCGPTGSGKTTTLYASLAALETTSRNVCSVEEPNHRLQQRLPDHRQPQARRDPARARRRDDRPRRPLPRRRFRNRHQAPDPRRSPGPRQLFPQPPNLTQQKRSRLLHHPSVVVMHLRLGRRVGSIYGLDTI